MIEVIEAIYQEEYKVWLKFNAGEIGTLNLTEPHNQMTFDRNVSNIER